MENSVEELLEIEVEEREFLRNSTKLYLDKVITEDGTKKRDLVDKLSSVLLERLAKGSRERC